MRLKRRFMACSLLAIMICLICQTTIAYFTDQATARNEITTGGIQIALTGMDGAETVTMMPGSVVEKAVAVQNKRSDAYVRVKCTITVEDAQAQPMELTAEELAALISLNFDSENWTEKDGWWYCNAPLATGETSKPLFTQMTFSTDMGNEFQSCTVTMDVQAQATQVANNGTDVFTAAGWPAE